MGTNCLHMSAFEFTRISGLVVPADAYVCMCINIYKCMYFCFLRITTAPIFIALDQTVLM